MVTSTATEVRGPSVRATAGWKAGAIALVWAGIGLVGASLGETLRIGELDVFWLLAVGSAAAIPIVVLIGRSLAADALNGAGYMLPMVLGTVVGTAGVIAVVFGAFVGIDAFFRSEFGALEALIRSVAGGAMMTIIAFVIGVIIFSLPGAILAALSAWIWRRWI